MKKKTIKEDRFVEGVWYAIQQLVISHGEDSYAAMIARESGISAEEFGLTQKLNGYENRTMNAFLKKTFHLTPSKPLKTKPKKK